MFDRLGAVLWECGNVIERLFLRLIGSMLIIMGVASGVGALASIFSCLASIVAFQILWALGFFFLIWLAYVAAALFMTWAAGYWKAAKLV